MKVRDSELDLTHHGDVSEVELHRLGYSRGDVVDFAVNVNPLGCSAVVRQAIADAAVVSYPERYAETLANVLADHNEVGAEQVLVGNGATELIWAIVRWCTASGVPEPRLCCLEPTFSEARRAAEAHGLPVTGIWADERTGFCYDWEVVARELERLRPSLVYVCLPNNPTGHHSDRSQILSLAEANPRCRFLLDESFLALSKQHAERTLPHPANVVRVRSLTKDLGIAGLRLGYVLGSRQVIESLRQLQPPWSVNAAAQAAGLAGLQHWALVEAAREELLRLNAELSGHLRYLGLPCLNSSSVFQLVEVGDAAHVARQCLRQGVLVRDCSSFGLSRYIRVCARPHQDQQRLLRALRDCV